MSPAGEPAAIVHGTPPNLHGRFVPTGPAATIDSGQLVSIRDCPDVGWGLEPPTSTTAPRRKVEPREPGPCLCGPIEVRGAELGDTLEIAIERFDVTQWGWTYGGQGATPSALARVLGLDGAPLTLRRWSNSPAAGVATDAAGGRVPLRPFPGCLGVAPADPGADGWTPRATGGNMDCPELVEGTTIFLPVEVPGAMLSIGDAHAAQGEGELSGTAIECGIVRADLRLAVRKRLRLRGPRIRTPGGWVTLGFGESLDHAAHEATNAMLDLMETELHLPRAEALTLASAQVSLRVTQMVNPRKGVHAMLRLG